MKYYSDVTHKLYDSAEELEIEEAKILKAEEEKRNGKILAEAAIEEAYSCYSALIEEMKELQKKINESSNDVQETLKNFYNTYGYYPEKYKKFLIYNFLF